MSGFLSAYDGTDDVRFGDYTVKIRQYLSGAARETAENKRMRVAATATGGAGEQQLSVTSTPDPVAYQEELLAAGIVEWDLTDRDGRLLPLAPEAAKRASIRLLPDVVYRELVARLEANIDKTRKAPEEHKTFRDDGDGTDAGGTRDAAGASEVLAATGFLGELRD